MHWEKLDQDRKLPGPHRAVSKLLAAITDNDTQLLGSLVCSEMRPLVDPQDLMKKWRGIFLKEIARGLGMADVVQRLQDGSVLVLVAADVPSGEATVIDGPEGEWLPGWRFRCVSEGGEWKVDPRAQTGTGPYELL